MMFFRFSGIANKLWAFAQMGAARRPLAACPELRFFKLMGAGTGEGFTPKPDTGAVALLLVWDDLATARRALASLPVLARYRARADEQMVLHLETQSVWGAWSGQAPFRPATGPERCAGPVVALTRATVRPTRLAQFWRRVPDISAAIGSDPNVLFKIGVGEVPWLHQMTFSIWPDLGAMAQFARANGPHARAIRAVRDGDWFAEELYARFALVEASGCWNGRALDLSGPAIAAE
ncbi:spheroidene monooxygenase [Oceanibium sediminis]|uniref:spheroidene monooxygenase n=1 Tax=Oceanibium sediminis TaxID=2026339 RepID=UPI001E52056D|nr:spheroidene monooxygenase [Oceanibium sediminis]